MSDFLSIGASAINVYRQAIATTSNNISNVNTEGYSKQEVRVSESYPTQVANFFIGTGSMIENIQRSYDEFVERSLRDSSSDVEATTPFIEYTNRIVDIVGSETSNLASAMDAFFDASQRLSVEPGSIPLRNDVLNTGKSLASRFNTLSTQVDSVAAESKERVKTALAKINGLAEQLLSVNKQLGRKSEAALQPSQLMDQRDLILRKMAAIVNIGVTEAANGQVTVNFGGQGQGFVFVNSKTTQTLGMVADATDPSANIQLVIDPVGKKQPLPNVTGGELGGLMTFRNEIVKVMRDGLDHIAVEFADKVNATHHQGIDLNGEFGRDVFTITPSYHVSGETLTGAVSVDLKIKDFSDLPSDTMKVIYRESSDSWVVFSGNSSYPDAELSSANAFTYKGLQLVVAGQANDGDTLTISPQDRPATTFSMTLEDPYRLAAAEPMSMRPSPSNSGDVSVDLDYIPPEERTDGFSSGIRLNQLTPNLSSDADFTLRTSNIRPVVTIDANTSSPSLLLDIGPNSDQQIQILTANAVHLAGTELSGSEASQLMVNEPGFNSSAAYNKDYLNKTGTDAYLDTSIRLGAIGQTKTTTIHEVDPNSGAMLSREIQLAPQISSKVIPRYNNTSGQAVELVGDGELLLNGKSLGALSLADGASLSAADVKNWLKSEIAALGLTDINVTAKTEIQVSEIDASKTLVINGVDIDFDVYTDMGEMVEAINAKSAESGVKAVWNSTQSFSLVNMSGHEGENIILGGTDAVTALGISKGTYTGQFEMTGPMGSEIALTIGSGQPSDLGRLGLYTGVYLDGPLNEELAVFVTGSGTVGASISTGGTVAQAEVSNLPARPYKINFTSNDIYTITDTATETVVAKRLFEYGKPIEYGGTSIMFNDKPQKGDEFYIEANTNAAGNNKNLLELIELSKRPIISGQTFSEAYHDLVSGIGSRSTMAELQKEALQVVYEQAFNTREESAGVNLDDEAANLIRFQQAYQAAAQVIQASQKVFDILIQAS